MNFEFSMRLIFRYLLLLIWFMLIILCYFVIDNMLYLIEIIGFINLFILIWRSWYVCYFWCI